MPRRIPLRDLFPSGPVLGAAGRRRWRTQLGPSGAAYASAPQVAFPVLPVSVFGATYDLDLVLVDSDPRWDMHELARVTTPQGPLWLCKDASDGDLVQRIVADHPDIDALVPEIPLERGRRPVRVEDRSTETWLDLDLHYTSLEGVAVDVHYEGPVPAGPQRKRNSSTMGHSRAQVLAVLDVSHKALARRASVTLDGVPSPLRRIACVVPFAVALRQVQAGFAVGAWTQITDGQGSRTTWASGVSRHWTHQVIGDRVVMEQAGPLRTLRFVFAVTDGRHELERAEVHPYGAAQPALVAHFAPRLPDVACALSQPWEGGFLLDVGGQPSHGVGRVRVVPVDGGVDVQLLPTAPRWTKDRPMCCRVRLQDGCVRVEVVRVP